MSDDTFLRPALSPAHLDVYVVRRAILRALTRQLPRFSGTLLDLGCGYRPYRSLVLSPPSRATRYVGVDLPGTVYGRPDLAWNGWQLPVAADTVDTVLLTEVLEHCPRPDLVLGEVSRVLRGGGALFATVPFLWPLHEVPRDEQRLTPFALRRLLDEAGFAGVEIEALGGWDAALAQMVGLWVRRRLSGSGWARVARAVLVLPALAVVRILLGRDRPPVEFPEGTMITGLAAVATKPTHASGRTAS